MAAESEINVIRLNRNFGLTVRELREGLSWSQEQLAEKAKLNRSFIGEIERGIASPSLKTITKLAVALQTIPSSLIARCEGKTGGLMAIAC
jgi:XRE family transcriptional regulator, regulator of sulfur utilization